MKPGTLIIIALLGVIAYALLRQPPAGSIPTTSQSTLREILDLAQRLIPPAKSGDQGSAPTTQDPTAEPGNADPSQRPNGIFKSKDAPNAGSSGGKTRLTWDPFSKGELGERTRYSARVREHLDADCLLIRCSTPTSSGLSAETECVLAGYPGAADAGVNSQIDFYGYSNGAVTYDNDTETKSLTLLVYSDGAPPVKTDSPPPNGGAPAAPAPGSWMWQRNGTLDRGAYDRR